MYLTYSNIWASSVYGNWAAAVSWGLGWSFFARMLRVFSNLFAFRVAEGMAMNQPSVHTTLIKPSCMTRSFWYTGREWLLFAHSKPAKEVPKCPSLVAQVYAIHTEAITAVYQPHTNWSNWNHTSSMQYPHLWGTEKSWPILLTFDEVSSQSA